jgi:hypothetical protein
MNVMQNYSANKGRNTRRHTIIVPRLVMTNTDYATIMKFVELFNRASVGVHVQKGRRGNPKHLPVYKATINGHKRCLGAIPILLQECITKKSALHSMMDWLSHRESEWHYSIKDYELYQAFMKASGKNPNDSTLRRLYDSCTAEEYKGREYPIMAWESRRKVESARRGNLTD